jgi:hypothetical protein
MSRIIMSEQPGRKLSQIMDNAYWDALPKHIRGLPVYFRLLENGEIELWPNWEGMIVTPNVWVSP